MSEVYLLTFSGARGVKVTSFLAFDSLDTVYEYFVLETLASIQRLVEIRTGKSLDNAINYAAQNCGRWYSIHHLPLNSFPKEYSDISPQGTTRITTKKFLKDRNFLKDPRIAPYHTLAEL